MFPKINPKMMKQAMKQMGIKEEVLDGVEEVIIRFSDKELVIKPAQVSKVHAMGNDSWQVQGDATERKVNAFSPEDVKTVMNQAGCDEDKAKEALTAADGDLAIAILALKETS